MKRVRLLVIPLITLLSGCVIAVRYDLPAVEQISDHYHYHYDRGSVSGSRTYYAPWSRRERHENREEESRRSDKASTGQGRNFPPPPPPRQREQSGTDRQAPPPPPRPPRTW